MHVHRVKPRIDTSQDAYSRKPTKIPEGIAETIKAEKAEPNREVDLGLLGLKMDSDMQGSAMLEEEDDTLILERSSDPTRINFSTRGRCYHCFSVTIPTSWNLGKQQH